MPLSDILACPEEQLEAAITDSDPYSKGSWFMSKGIAMIELCQLGEMIDVDSYDSLTGGFSLVGEELPDGPWPQSIPSSLTDRLSEISDEEIAEVCSEWCEIEEFGGGAPEEVLVDYLSNLREFLVTNDGPYFLVNSL